ncbi:MAG: hypothetical protein LUH22_02515 [Bacteroides sp.]|nr:hypothetical protein [Bacteroides sp.]
MKSIFATIAAGVLICFLYGACKSADAGISMLITPNTFEKVPANVKLTVINTSDTIAQYGANYVIEELQNEEWVRMPFNDELAFIDLLYIQPSGETREYTISLYPDMGEYKKGKYRIRKNINLGDENVDVTAEFEIK